MTYNAQGGIVVDEAAVESERARMIADGEPLITDPTALRVLARIVRQVEERQHAERRDARRRRRAG